MSAKENENGVDEALASLQSQINELKAQLAERPPIGAELEDAIVALDDFCRAMSPAYFAHDVREHTKRVTAAADVIRERRAGRVEGKQA